MFLTKLKIMGAVLALGGLGTVTNLFAQKALAEKPPARSVSTPAGAISADRFDPLVQLILPAAERGETKWLEIPWMTDTLAARRKAAAEDKPVVVWSMSACPLGGD
jgi:hypothetical protein